MYKMIVSVVLLFLLQGCGLQQACPCPGVFSTSPAMKKHLQAVSHENLGYCHRHKKEAKRHCHRHK